MVERDTPSGREAWFNVAPDDLPRIVGGVEGTPITEIPFLQQQTRFTLANFGITGVRSMNTKRGGDSRDWQRCRACRRRRLSKSCASRGYEVAGVRRFLSGKSGKSRSRLGPSRNMW